MKMKTISTRVLAVFAAVLLITALSIPAFAATSYTFAGSDAGVGFCDTLPPEGTYWVTFYSSQGDFSITSAQPIEISYAVSGESLTHFWEGEFIFYEDGSCVAFPIVVARSLQSGSFVNVASLLGDNEAIVFEGDTLTFTPVYESPSITDYVSADTLPVIFDEITALLPIALGVIVGYIAIRKGIAYLQSFLHNS